MNLSTLFLRTLDDLAERTQSADEYRLIRSAGLIRHLLIDGDRLLDQVNGFHRLPIRFEVHGSPIEAEKEKVLWSVRPHLRAPEWVPVEARGVRMLKSDAFLGEKVVILNGQSLSVRSLVQHICNIRGGVHSHAIDRSGEPTTQAWLDAEGGFTIGELDSLIHLLREIGVVVVDALTPLGVAAALDPGKI